MDPITLFLIGGAAFAALKGSGAKQGQIPARAVPTVAGPPDTIPTPGALGLPDPSALAAAAGKAASSFEDHVSQFIRSSARMSHIGQPPDPRNDAGSSVSGPSLGGASADAMARFLGRGVATMDLGPLASTQTGQVIVEDSGQGAVNLTDDAGNVANNVVAGGQHLDNWVASQLRRF